MDNTALNATVIQKHIQNSVKHLRWSFMKKKLFSQNAPS